MDVVAQFQSTRPMRGATKSEQSINRTARFQSTRPVWGATLRLPPEVISPSSFNPRAPCGARRTIDHIRHSLTLVSIHAPRMGRDLWGVANPRQHDRFNPRAPCGARRTAINNDCIEETFQSTRPVWGATNGMHLKTMNIFVSIHAPRVGRDKGSFVPRTKGVCFNPRAPCGARLSLLLLLLHCLGFQSTRPVWGATQTQDRSGRACSFQSTRPVWGATATGVTTSPFCHVFMGIPLHKYDFLGT